MDIEKLLSGIALVIDDELKKGEENDERIFKIVKKIKKLKIPMCTEYEIPSDKTYCNNLLQSASFVLLDWNLWGQEASELEEYGIKQNIKFLNMAKENFTPVFIFTNENPAYIENHLGNLYDKEDSSKNFIFIKKKSELVESKKFLDPIEDWLTKNASVYTLKAWEQAFNEAKRYFFCSMYDKSPNWPRVFWSCYKEDGVEPSSSIVNLINDCVLAHVKTTQTFEEQVLGEGPFETESKDIRSLLSSSSFIPRDNSLSKDEVKAGDIFKISSQKYLINIRPDCDCVPREGQDIGDVELFCIEGSFLTVSQAKKEFNDKYGNFKETIGQAIVFGIYKGKTISFNFNTLTLKPFREIKEKHIGRLIHPYITRIQQRYAFYLQRQGLPRLPAEAIKNI